MNQILEPFTKRTGEIIQFSEYFANERTGAIEYTNQSYPVLISNEFNVIYLSSYGRLAYLDIRKFKKFELETNKYHILGNAVVYRRKYGFTFGSLQDGIVAQCYSFHSKRINDKRAFKALETYINKEFGAFSGMAESLRNWRET